MKSKQIQQLDEISRRLDSSGLAQYVRLTQQPWRVLGMNFLSGIARGLGFTIGTAIVVAIAYRIISEIISMNIPYLTDMLQEFLKLLRSEL